MNEVQIKEHVVEPLPAVIRSDGFTLEQIKRVGSIAIYRKSRGEYSGYEVVKIRVRKPEQIRGVQYPARETYPCSEGWGVYGWTFRTVREAEAKLEALQKQDLSRNALSRCTDRPPTNREEPPAISTLGKGLRENNAAISGFHTRSRGNSKGEPLQPL